MLLWNHGFICSDFLNSANLVKGAVTGIMPMDQGKGSGFHQSLQADQVVGIKDFGDVMPECLEKKQEKPDMGINVLTLSKAKGRQQNQLPDNKLRVQKMTQNDSNSRVKPTNIFRGKTFCFSNSFPDEKVRYMDL